MGLSALNQHRHKYNFIPSPFCDTCGDTPEDTVHYMLYCPTFQNARNTLLLLVAPLIVDITPDIHNIRSRRHAEVLVKILLSGDKRLSTEVNHNIITHVFTYISATTRFR